MEGFKTRIMAYNSPDTINFSNGTEELMPYINDVTNGWFGRGFILSIWIILVIGYLKLNKDDYFGAFAVASWVCVVLGMLGWVMHLVRGLDIGLIVAVSILSTVGLILNRKQ